MTEDRTVRVASILACPVCREPLAVVGARARCSICGRVYSQEGDAWILLAEDHLPSLPRHGHRFGGRWQLLLHTPAGRIYRRVFVHPARFVGDLQRTGLANYHRRLAQFLDSFPSEATIVDVGSGSRRLRPHIITLDVARGPVVDLVADAHHLPLASGSVDGLIVQQVLEHVADPSAVVAEIVRALRPGGRVYAEVPFLYPVHDALDFRRWTATGLQLLFSGFLLRDSGVAMGPGSALAAIVRRSATAFTADPRVEAGVDLVLGWLLAPLKYLDEFLVRWPATTLAAGAVFVEAEKQSP